jgi:hypothetical protein
MPLSSSTVFLSLFGWHHFPTCRKGTNKWGQTISFQGSATEIAHFILTFNGRKLCFRDTLGEVRDLLAYTVLKVWGRGYFKRERWRGDGGSDLTNGWGKPVQELSQWIPSVQPIYPNKNEEEKKEEGEKNNARGQFTGYGTHSVLSTLGACWVPRSLEGRTQSEQSRQIFLSAQSSSSKREPLLLAMTYTCLSSIQNL